MHKGLPTKLTKQQALRLLETSRTAPMGSRYGSQGCSLLCPQLDIGGRKFWRPLLYALRPRVPWTSEKREASLLDFVCVASCLIDKTFRRNTPAFVFIYL